MDLLRETYSFINKEGKEVTAYRYYVEVYGVKVYLVCKEKSDTKYLNNMYRVRSIKD